MQNKITFGKVMLAILKTLGMLLLYVGAAVAGMLAGIWELCKKY